MKKGKADSDSDDSGADKKKALKKKGVKSLKELNLETDTDILSKLYAGDKGAKIDKKDAFLREYILG